MPKSTWLCRVEAKWVVSLRHFDKVNAEVLKRTTSALGRCFLCLF